MLPIKTSQRGPAPPYNESMGTDIIDETMASFRANVLFKNYEVLGASDRTLIYLTLFVQQCLTKVGQSDCKDKKMAKASLYQLAIKGFSIPGESGFCLGGMFPAPDSRDESDAFKAYFKQCRVEISERVLDVFYTESGEPNKWWKCFQKKKFMGKEMGRD
jgi:actin related protein 2/3 complex subunit 3